MKCNHSCVDQSADASTILSTPFFKNRSTASSAWRNRLDNTFGQFSGRPD